MLKLNASYSKKVPAETEYSSQSYHASVEVELPDGLTPDQLQERIHATFALVRESVETEIHGASQAVTHPVTQPVPQTPTPYSHAAKNEIPASPKQIRYLLDLARNKGITAAQIAAKYGVESVDQLTKSQCSGLINTWKEVA